MPLSPQVQAALQCQQDLGAALWYWAMSSPVGCQGAPGAAGPPQLVGQSQALSDPLLAPPSWSPLLLSPSLPPLPRAAPPWKQEWEVSRAQPAAPEPSTQGPRAPWSSEGDPPHPRRVWVPVAGSWAAQALQQDWAWGLGGCWCLSLCLLGRFLPFTLSLHSSHGRCLRRLCSPIPSLCSSCGRLHLCSFFPSIPSLCSHCDLLLRRIFPSIPSL